MGGLSQSVKEPRQRRGSSGIIKKRGIEYGELEKGFPEFLSNVKEGDLKAEYLLPAVIDECIHSGKGTVRVLETKDKWFGVTYKEDKPAVVASIQKLVDAGVYPKKLF